MIRLLFSSAILLLFSNLFFAQTWTFQDVDFGAKPSIVLDAQDRPHIAYMLEETNGGFVKHAMLQDTGFQITLIDQAYFYGPLDIAIDQNDHLGIAVHNHDVENEYIYRWDGLLWEALPVESDGHDGWDNALTFDSKGNIHSSSIDPAQFGSDLGVEYAYFDGNVWTKESINAGPASYKFSTDIQVDENDAPHIVFYDDFGDKLVYANKTNGNWRNYVVAGKGGAFPSMLLDDNNRPHIAYYEQVEENRGRVHYVRYENGDWQSEVVDELADVPISFTGARRMTSLAKDSNGSLHLCYGDRQTVKYAIRQNEMWTIEEVVNYAASDTLLGAQVSLALDSRDQAHITYFELASTSPVSGMVRYGVRRLLSSHEVVLPTAFDWQIQPNPVQDELTIFWKNTNFAATHFRLLDAAGQLIISKSVEHKNKFSYSLQHLPTGVYYAQIRVGQNWETQKVVKQ